MAILGNHRHFYLGSNFHFMRFLVLLTFFYCLNFSCSAQNYDPSINFDSLSHVSYVGLHDTYLNDIWGHVDANGNEYAIVGARKGVSVVDVTNPQNPSEVYWEEGDESIWRDINTFNNYAYVTTEAESGLMILNMNSLPNANGISSSYYTGPVGNEWQSAHTLFIDSAGYAYVFGANRGNGGVIILDIQTDPFNPIEVGVFDNWYCHDGYVLGDTMYLAHIADGFISIVDISDRSNPVLLGTKNTHNTFSHNIWVSPDRKYAFTTDEVSGAFVGSYDISDPANIVELDLVQNSPGLGVIPHNVHYLDGFLVCSYYSDGVVVFDGNKPDNLVKVASFDTYPAKTIGFDGTWAAYPFLPSGIVVAADITEGLFIYQPTYQRASYLEGNITNQGDNSALSNVKIQFENSDVSEFSKTNGDYATGNLGVGQFNVTFSKVGFYPRTESVTMVAGVVNVFDLALTPIPQFPFTITVKDKKTNLEILDAHVKLTGSLTEDEVLTNGLGEAIFSLYYQENYQIVVGKWGFRTDCFEQTISNTSGSLTVYLDQGYQDDFTFDFDWNTAFIGAVMGFWERGKPNGTNSNSAPSLDSDSDCGDEAFVTGNSASLDPDFDEVRDGLVLLYSPIFDLSDGKTPYIHYERWFYNFYGPITPYDDTLKIMISNGDSTVLLDAQGSDESTFFTWNKKSFYLPDYIGLNSNMQLIIKVSDYLPAKNITEAGFDNFFMDSLDHFAINEIPFNGEFKVLPNPFTEQLTIYNAPINSEIKLFDLQGNIVLQHLTTQNTESLVLTSLRSGMYFVRIENQLIKVIKI